MTKAITTTAPAWAWVMEGRLCFWAMPTKEDLIGDGSPSPEARPVRVRLVPEVEYRRLRKAAEAAGEKDEVRNA